MTRYVRIPGPDGPRFGRVVDTHVEIIDPHPFTEHVGTGERISLEGLRLLAPVIPSKVVAAGRNYAEHAREMDRRSTSPLHHDDTTSTGGSSAAGEMDDAITSTAAPKPTSSEPTIFLMPGSAVIGPGDPIRIPTALTSEVHHEAELAIVIGRILHDVTPEEALVGIFGYTCANDVTARDLQRDDGQWWRAKGMDSFLPLGPAITTDLDTSDLAITCRVDGELRQDGTTADMLTGVADLVSYISKAMTLLPADVVLTGTPAGVGPIEDGNVVEVAIEGIGALVNPVRTR